MTKNGERGQIEIEVYNLGSDMGPSMTRLDGANHMKVRSNKVVRVGFLIVAGGMLLFFVPTLAAMIFVGKPWSEANVWGIAAIFPFVVFAGFCFTLIVGFGLPVGVVIVSVQGIRKTDHHSKITKRPRFVMLAATIALIVLAECALWLGWISIADTTENIPFGFYIVMIFMGLPFFLAASVPVFLTLGVLRRFKKRAY